MISLDKLAMLYQTIERAAKWPANLLEVPVTTLKKGKGDTPLQVRPISLTSHIYRMWAEIPWVHLQPWHLQWVPKELHGGIANRQTLDSYFAVALDIEQSSYTNHPLYGILYDYAKCFDNICWQIERGVLIDLGMPPAILNTMFAYNQSIQRRFKLGNSIGPSFPNTNSICQGCPLAIIRINAMITAWIQVISNHSTTSYCRASAFIDDKNLRSTSSEHFTNAVHITKKFDQAIDAVINSDKTTVFTTTRLARQKLQNFEFPQSLNDKLLGASLSFTKRRSRELADKRAVSYMAVAQRISICPLNIAAKETLLATAGAPKYCYALEMGPCSVHIERKLRSAICRALWSKGSHKSNDILLTICHKGHLIDPTQLKWYAPFQTACRQLAKHPNIRYQWEQIWHDSIEARAQYKNGKSNMVGPLSMFHVACLHLDWKWVEPFTIVAKISEHLQISVPILTIPHQYFLHLVRYAIARVLWNRAAASRKTLKGIR